MLGDSATKAHIEKSNSLDIKPRVFAEWNANSLNTPHMLGTGTAATPSEITTISSSASSPSVQTVSRGEGISINNSTSCSLLLSDNDEQSIVVNTLKIQGGVVTLGIKAPLKSDIGVGKDIFVSSGISSINGKFTTISGTDKTKIVYNTGNSSIPNVAGKTLRRGLVSLNESSYYVDFNMNASEAVRFFMMLKSDYMYQVSQIGGDSFIEDFDVVLTARGMKNNESVWSQVSTKRIKVNSIDWKLVELDFANPDAANNSANIDKVRLSIEISTSRGEKASLLVNKLYAFKISPYEVYSKDIIPLKNVFSPDRPGEFLLETGPINVSLSDTESFPQQTTNIHMAMRWAILRRFSKVQRSVLPYSGNPNSYYVSGSSSDSKKFWTIYQQSFKTNNIVIKVNSIINRPSAFTIKLLIGGSWTSVTIDGGASFNNSGILRIFYDGTKWSATEWAYNQYPKISQSTGNIDKQIEIQGIALEVSELSYSSNNAEIRGGTPAFDLQYLDLVEISPRLSLDLTDYLVGFSINKELGNNSTPLPLGSISSNSASIDFNKIPIIVGDSDLNSSETNDVIPISNYASVFVNDVETKKSPLKGMLVRGVKMRGFFDIDTDLNASGPSSTKKTVPAFVMYSERWDESNDSVKVECYDVIKRIQSLLCQPLYLRNKTVQEITYSILDSVGFCEYVSNDLITLRAIKDYSDQQSISEFANSIESVNYYWSNRDENVASALNDLFKTFQIAMFADERGAVRFTSLYELNRRINNISNEYVVKLQDFSDTNITSNIESFSIEENERPSKITMRYKKPYPYYSEPKISKKVKKIIEDRNASLVKTTNKIVWEPEQDALVLPYFELSAPGITSTTQKFIKFNADNLKYINKIIDYSGYLLIDKEILKYDGLEYIFTPVSISNNNISSEGQPFTHIVKSQQDIDFVLSDAIDRFGSKTIYYQPTGYMVNVERGQFGTTPSTHIIVNTNSPKDWVAREFDETYKNLSSLEESDGKYSLSNGRMNITSNKSSGGIILTPKQNSTVGNKRKLFARYGIGKIPANKSGYLGVAVGVKTSSGNITDGLFIFTGIESKDKKVNVRVFVQEVVNGKVKNILPKGRLKLDETLFDVDEQIEMYINFNAKRDSARIYIGPTSIFQKIKKGKDKEGNKTEKIIDVSQDISFKIENDSQFGFIALENGRGWLDDFAFTSKSDPRNLNVTNIDNIEDNYNYDEKVGNLFYIGPNSLLNQIVYNRNVEMSMSNPLNKDNFVWTGAPVARGLKILDIEFNDFPISGNAKAKFLGYTYEVNSIKTTNSLRNSDTTEES